MKKSASVSFETGPAPPRVHIAGFAIVATVLAIVAIWSGVDAWNLDNTGIRTTGRVVEHEGSGDASYPVFEFSDALGRSHAVRAAISAGNYPVGSEIPVIYPEDRPLTARIDDRIGLYFWTVFAGILCSVFLAGMWLIVKFRANFQAIFAARVGKLRVSRRGPSGTTTHTERSSSPLLTWIGRILGAGAVLWVVAAIWAGWQGFEFMRSGVTTQGVVVELVRIGRRHQVHVQFKDVDSELHRIVLPDKSNDYLVGDSIGLIYPNRYPRDVRVRSWSVFFGWSGYFTILAFVFILTRVAIRIQLTEIEKAGRSADPER